MVITSQTVKNKSTEELQDLLEIKTLPNVKKAIIRKELKNRENSEPANEKTENKDMAKEDKKSAASNKSKGAQKKEKKVGVIATILNTITNAKKPVTKAQILKVLVKNFPDRSEASMAKTINAQIGSSKRPLRMEKEKNVTFVIVENDDKEKRTYAIK